MSFSLTRRAFVGVSLACAFALPAFAQDAQKLRFSAVFSEKDIRAQMMQKFAEGIGEGFAFEPYYGGNLFKQGTELVALQRGNLEMGNIAPQDVANQVPGVLDPDRGLRLPRRRPHARLLRQRLRQGDGRPRRGAARHQDPRADLLRHPPGRAEAGEGDQDPRRHGRDQAPHARRRRLAVPRQGARRQPDADGLCRGLHRAADRRDRRPGQPAAERREHEVLRGDEPDRADLAPRRLRPAHHLQDRLGRAARPSSRRRSSRPPPRRSTGARPST